MPQRHSKNNGSSTYGVFSYHERRKNEFLQNLKARLGADAQLPFGYCWLSLQPAVDPVVTPSGHIYSREHILEHLVSKTQDLKRQRDAWEAAERTADREADARARQSRQLVERDFAELNDPRARPTKQARVVDDKPDANFWLPQLAPQAPPEDAPPPPPPKRPPSPVTGAPLRAKDLVPIDLHRSSDDARCVCHVSHDEITTQPVLFIRSTGCVVIESVATNLGVLESHVCPVTSRKFKEKDLLRLVAATSAYSASGGTDLVVTKYRPTGGGA